MNQIDPNLMTLGPWSTLLAYLWGAIAIAAVVCAAFLYVRRNGGKVAVWVCLMMTMLGWAMACVSIVLINISSKSRLVSKSGYYMYHFGMIPVAVLLVVMIFWIIRSKNLKL